MRGPALRHVRGNRNHIDARVERAHRALDLIRMRSAARDDAGLVDARDLDQLAGCEHAAQRCRQVQAAISKRARPELWQQEVARELGASVEYVRAYRAAGERARTRVVERPVLAEVDGHTD